MEDLAVVFLGSEEDRRASRIEVGPYGGVRLRLQGVGGRWQETIYVNGRRHELHCEVKANDAGLETLDRIIAALQQQREVVASTAARDRFQQWEEKHGSL